LTTSEDMFLL